MVLQKKDWGYDNLSVAWSGPDSNDVQEIIPGTSLIPFDQVELVAASAPNPANRATDADREPTLSWVPGEFAAKHDVYFGTDEEAVENATMTSPEYKVTSDIGTDSFGPGILEFNTTYYWRIDEVNDAHPDSLWIGNVWSFTTGNFLIVDDFESYNDIEVGEEGSNLVYNTWADGYDNPAVNGSTIGYSELFQPSMETEIVHGGSQSVPVAYDNSIASLSEVTVNPADLAIGSDWTADGAQALSLWFYGDPNNTTTEQMYVKVNGAKVMYDGELTQEEWQAFSIDLTTLGVNLNNVATFVIGFEKTGAAGGSGTVLIDDIRLYLPKEQ